VLFRRSPAWVERTIVCVWSAWGSNLSRPITSFGGVFLHVCGVHLGVPRSHALKFFLEGGFWLSLHLGVLWVLSVAIRDH